MVNGDRFRKVYCFVRAAERSPMERVLESLDARCIQISRSAKSKIIPLVVEMGLPRFGLSEGIIEKLKTDVSLIQQLARPVDLNIPLSTFTPHLVGLQNLLKLSLKVYRSKPAFLFFCSSISTAANTTVPGPVPDEAIDDVNFAASTVYARPKLIGGYIVRNATGAGAHFTMCYVSVRSLGTR
jgi:thioester reductase-like protein